MASWSAVLALTGFHYSGLDKSLQLSQKEGQYFWSNGYSWGPYEIQKTGDMAQLRLRVLHGKLALNKITLEGLVPNDFKKMLVLEEGGQVSINFKGR
jgi:hypothetical protein